MGDFTFDLKASIAIVAIITAITIAYLVNWWRNRKSLSYEIKSNLSLLSSSEIIRDKLQILYDGLLVKNVRLLVLNVVNDGKLPIIKNDFVKPLCFRFSEDTQILAFELIDVKPSNLEVQLTCKENNLFIETDLLNSDDSISIKLIISSYKFDVNLDTRIVGIKETRRTNAMVTSVRRSYGWLAGTFGLAMFISIFFLTYPMNILVAVVTLLAIPVMLMEANDFVKKFRALEKRN